MKRFFIFLRRRSLPLWVGFNILIAAMAVFSGYSGEIDPEVMPIAGPALLTFPLWYFFTVVLLIVNLFICRPLSLVNIATVLIALKPFLVFCPLNFGKHELTPEQEPYAFSIMSYNTLSFFDENAPDPSYNRTMREVLNSEADVLVLLEFENMGHLSKFVPAVQIDSLHSLYPYFERGACGTVMFSKRPIMHIQPPENRPSKGSIEIFRTQVKNRPINIFAVHLESFGLDSHDKQVYKEFTDKTTSRTEIASMRQLLIGKLYQAFRNRGYQAMLLREYADNLGGNSIICGDFNDVAGCRVIKVLEEAGFSDVYSAVGFGPTVTFNDPYFFFRIDHVLWRGDFKPIKIKRGNVPSSDHYPFLTTFVWNTDVPAID